MLASAIPTSISRDELNLLQAVCMGRRVYEAGALLGASTCHIAQVAKHLTSVDPHEGYPRHNPRPTWESYCRNIAPYTNIEAHRDVFQNVLRANLDVAWADLTGRRDVMLNFIQQFQTTPILAIHDYGRSACGDASDVVDWFIRRTGCKAFCVGTLIVLERS